MRLEVENNYQIAEEMLEKEIKNNIDDEIIQYAKDNLSEASQNRENFYNQREYELKRKQWEKNNPEAAKKLEAKRKRRNVHGPQSLVDDAAEKAVRKEVAEEASNNLKKSTMKNFGHIMNAGIAISDYKDAREAGHSVARSTVKAGAEFVKGELFGGWYMAAMLAKSAPTMAVSAIEGINTMSRSMNSMSRRQVFGDASFQDTQQLATMRQSGMELAKMSQYNLQQTLMGNEAEYLHKL